MTLQKRQFGLYVVLVAGIICIVPIIYAQNSTPVVSLDSGPIVQLCADCTPNEIRLAVTPKRNLRIRKFNKVQEDPKIVEVSFGNLRDASLASQFVPRWELSPLGVPIALIIRVDPKIRKTGNYDLLLNLQPGSAPTAPRLKIQIIHPAGKILEMSL